MATTFQTTDSKLSYHCRRVQRAGISIALTITERGRPKEVQGRVLDVALEPDEAGTLIWQITIH